jgi:nucleotide-binding universal stress UspA family protein
MFNRILIPLDGSSLAECVLPHALAIARANNPHFYFFRVIDPVGQATRPRTVDPLDWNIRKNEAEAYLNNISSQWVDNGLSASSEVREGKTAEAIIQYIQEKGIDLTILSSHGRSGLTGWNISSVVQKTILRARTSVLLVRAYQVSPERGDVHYKKILLPLDGSQRAESALGIILQLAKSQEATVVAAHVIQKPAMPRRRPLSPEDSHLAERIVERNRAAATEYLASLKTEAGGLVETRLDVSANVAYTLHQIVEEDQIDLVALTAHGCSGNSGWIYGSVVITFIAYGTTPLLIYQDMVPESIEQTKAERIALDFGER